MSVVPTSDWRRRRAAGDDAAGVQAAFVVVSGPPASGKSTLAPQLAVDLRLPLVAKDMIKDALMSMLPVPDADASRQLGRAARQGDACDRGGISAWRRDREQLLTAPPPRRNFADSREPRSA